MSKTLTIDDNTFGQLAELAAEEKTSVEALVMEAVRERLRSRRVRPRPKFIGMVESGQPGAARRSGDEPAIPPPWRS